MAGVKGQRSGGNRSKTLAQHDLEGTRNATRHKGFRNPEPPEGEPTPPNPLKGEAKAEWGRMIADLRKNGSLSSVHGRALSNYCQAWANAKRLQQAFDQLRLIDMDGSSLPTKVNTARLTVDRLQKNFGMTPDSLGRVRIPSGQDEKKDSPLEAIQRRAALRRVKRPAQGCAASATFG